ncbi:YlxM family DNA-binding protein [Fusobacterium sp.]|uniref:YlxM family DNA-binding protein n=1 Tax=Fusobacterium sp. TaxID=68766 RepID=UPI00396C6AC6
MKLNEFLEISILLDYYRNLLSDKQREYLINHFEEDLSLTEIANNNGISRQAVYDNIRRGINQLKEYEEKLGFHQKEKKIYSELMGLKEDFTVERLDEIIKKLF